MQLLYRRLDQMRAQTEALRDTYRHPGDNTPGGRVQRDIGYAHHSATLTGLNLAEDRLCFGRLDRTDGSEQHIGRLGIFEEGTGDRQLLMDWRAPSARPFYVATAAAPLDVVRRRHLQVRRRQVRSLSDEYLDTRPEALAALGVSPAAVAATAGPAGESALLGALNAPRTGRMSDIVSTIQAEQDRIIRAERAGVLVVQGGPGTGKTAVVLHRVAFLLYTFRDLLANRGVLVIGPNQTFLSYIGQVLPSLGENAVVLSTVADLFPGVRASGTEPVESAVIKGRLSMVPVIANAVLGRQRVPATATPVRSAVGRLTIEPGVWRAAQRRAWGSRLPHNRARGIFVRTVINGLARQVAAGHRVGLGAEIPFTEDDLADARTELRADDAVRMALAGVWPALTAPALLADLFARPAALRFASPGLSERQRQALARPAGSPFTPADVPLLDEVAELLGEIPAGAAAAPPEPDVADYAQDVLDMLAQEHPDAEADTGTAGADGATGPVAAGDLLALRGAGTELTSTSERAAADREWTYGHVVVDEAQELSPMAWRLVLRRCPVRSMTVVGDIAQTGDPAGVRSWSAALRPHVQNSFRVEELTVNYRTPVEITAVADRVLARIDPTLRPPEAVRSTGIAPWWRQVPAEKLVAATMTAVLEELDRADEQNLAVVVPRTLQAPMAAALAAASLAAAMPAAPPADRSGVAGVDQPAGRPIAELRDPAVVLTVAEVKGLEFDVVLLIEPDLIEAESPQGRSDVYVALTRATQRLGVLYSGAEPAIAG